MSVMWVVLLILLLLAGRELVSPGLKELVVRPVRLMLDILLRMGVQAHQPALLLLLVLIAGPLILVFLLLYSLGSDGVANFWHFVLSLVMTFPVFVDRRIPSVMDHYRKQWLDAAVMEGMKERVAQARGELLLSALQELFSPLFWLILLGPIGAVFYYLVRCCDEQVVAPDVAATARRLRAALDWLPSRALAISFALAGDFISVWKYLQLSFAEARSGIAAFIAEAGVLAEHSLLDQNLDSPVDMVRHLAHFESLCFRALGLWVVVMVLHALLP